jgi:hypothetical protein
MNGRISNKGLMNVEGRSEAREHNFIIGDSLFDILRLISQLGPYRANGYSVRACTHLPHQIMPARTVWSLLRVTVQTR